MPDRGAIDSYLSFAERLVTDFVDSSGASAATMRMGFSRATDNLPIHQFVEFFSRPTAGRELIDAALQLEQAAFARDVPEPMALATEAKTVLLLVADYKGLRRKSVLRGTDGPTIPKETNNVGQSATNLFDSK